jgi:hypothetical protein
LGQKVTGCRNQDENQAEGEGESKNNDEEIAGDK